MTTKLRRGAGRVYRSSPQRIVHELRDRASFRRNWGSRPPTLEFLRSGEYTDLMYRHVPYDLDYGLHEAETGTKSFMFRAFKADDVLRAYRWRGVQEHLDLILDRFAGSPGPVIDLGGAASPFGLGSIVVDRLSTDVDGRTVPYRSLSELPEPAGVIVSSHTLEHVPDLEPELERIARALVPGGSLIALLPAFSCVRWRAGVHSHASYGDHVWTFGLRHTPNLPDGLTRYVEIDALLEGYFHVESARYCGDDSILAVCRTS